MSDPISVQWANFLMFFLGKCIFFQHFFNIFKRLKISTLDRGSWAYLFENVNCRSHYGTMGRFSDVFLGKLYFFQHFQKAKKKKIGKNERFTVVLLPMHALAFGWGHYVYPEHLSSVFFFFNIFKC